MAESKPEIPWQAILDIFTEEIKGPNHAIEWEKFKTLAGDSMEAVIEFVYNLSVFRKRINGWLSKHPRSFDDHVPLNQDVPKHPELDALKLVTFGKNLDFPGASTAVEIIEDSGKGRYVIAARDICPGETLFVEDPYASVLCGGDGKFCDFCCLPLTTPVLCTTCRRTSFCSSCCLEAAARQYHNFECGSTLAPHVGIARLALRITLIAEAMGCIKVLKKTEGAGDETTSPEQTKYQRVMSLLTHFEDMLPEDKFHYALTSILLCMDQAHSRGIQGSSRRSAFVQQFGPRVLHHLTQMICNGNAITAYLMSARKSVGVSQVVQENQVRVATAIYPTASMMNHSCDPNILTSYIGRTLIARSTRPIKAGEEVYNCYGPHFTNKRTKERRDELKQQYFFDCSCPPCCRSQDFLDSEGIDAQICSCGGPVVKQETGELICTTCNTQLLPKQVYAAKIQLEIAASLLDDADHLSARENWAKAEKNVRQVLSLQEKFLHSYNRRLAETHDYLAMLLARQGKLTESSHHLEKSLAWAEHCFGKVSIEVLGILDTIIDVAAEELREFKGEEWKRKHSCAIQKCEQAISLTNLLLGPWHPKMSYLHSTLQHLQSSKESIVK